MQVPEELPTIVGYSVLLAISISMMLVIYNDHIFKDRPWVLYFLSGIIAFSMSVCNDIDIFLLLPAGILAGKGKEEDCD